MTEPAFDELIHAPLRLQICALLAPVRSQPFAAIRESLGVSDSVLSKHLSTLSDVGYIQVSRVRSDARSRRQVALTAAGRSALRGHLAALEAIVSAAERAVFETPEPTPAPGPGGAERGPAQAPRPRLAAR